MKYRDTGEYELLAENTSLVNFSKEYKIEQFDCGIEDYNNFLLHDAEYYMENNISSVHLLINNATQEVLGYLALLTDAFLLDPQEKDILELTMPFNSVPALKVGKLATSKNHKDFHYGSFLLELSLGKIEEINEVGIACRFLTVDADIEYNVSTPEFYEANGFIRNEHKSLNGKKRKSVSLRYDIFTA